jgi:hypothetical protein
MNENNYLVDFKKFRNFSEDVNFLDYINQFKNNKNDNKFNDDLINEIIGIRENLKNIKYCSSDINIENKIKILFIYLNLLNKLIKNFPNLLKNENQKIKLIWFDSYLNINESSNINLEIMSIKFNLAVFFFDLADSLENFIYNYENYDENEIFDLHTIKRYYRISAYILEQIQKMKNENKFNFYTMDFDENYLDILKNYSLAKAQNIIYIIVTKLNCNKKIKTEISYGVYYYYKILEKNINKNFLEKCELNFSILLFSKQLSSSKFNYDYLSFESENNLKKNKISSNIELIKKGYNDLDSLIKNNEFQKLKKEIDKKDEIENLKYMFMQFLDSQYEFLNNNPIKSDEENKKNYGAHFFDKGFKVESLNIDNMTKFIISKNYEIVKLKNEIKKELNEYLIEKFKKYQIEENEKFIDNKFLPNLVKPYVIMDNQNNNNEILQELLDFIYKIKEKYNYFKIDSLSGKLRKLKEDNKKLIEELTKKINDKNEELNQAQNTDKINNKYGNEWNDLEKYSEKLNYYSSKFKNDFIEKEAIQLYEKNKDIYILAKDSFIEKYKKKYSDPNLSRELKINKSNEFIDLYENSKSFRENLDIIKNNFKIIKQSNNDEFYKDVSSIKNELEKQNYIKKRKEHYIDKSLKEIDTLFEKLNDNKIVIENNFKKFRDKNHNTFIEDLVFLTKFERTFDKNINLFKKAIEKLESLKNKLELFNNELDEKFQTFYYIINNLD